MLASRGQWVQVRTILLEAGQRAPTVPRDTAAVPLELRVRGFLLDEAASLGESVSVCTLAHRVVQGELEVIEPRYTHDFGGYVPELSQAGAQLGDWLAGGESDEE